MESLLAQFYGEPMYAPQPIQRLRVDGGLYGQKTGAGWYTYDNGKKIEPPPVSVPDVDPGRVWVRASDHHQELIDPLIAALKSGGVDVEVGEGTAAPTGAVILIAPMGYDVTTAVHEVGLDGARTVAVDVLHGLKGPRTLMVSPATAPEYRDRAHAALARAGEPVIVVNDSPGFVSQRIVAHVINIACQIAQRGIATPEDIDKGAKLGLGYPFGPLEWGDRLGPRRVLFILERLHTFYGDPRYRPSAWLKRRAMLGLSLRTPDGRGVRA